MRVPVSDRSVVTFAAMRSSRMRGLMCQPHAACVPGDLRSVVVPRRPERTLVVDLKYARLADSSRRLGNPAGDDRKVPPAPAAPPSTVAGRIGRVEMRVAPRQRKTEQVALPPKRERGAEVPCSLRSGSDHIFQIVVMRVSLHCQGCAGKVKKHISKMEGVTSFSIDLESKRVTVMGHVSPAGVLESISKVKRAEFWNAAAAEA